MGWWTGCCSRPAVVCPALTQTVAVGHFITDQTDIRTTLIELQIMRRLWEVSDVMFLFFIANESVLF